MKEFIPKATVIGSDILSGIFYAHTATIYGCRILTILLFGENLCLVSRRDMAAVLYSACNAKLNKVKWKN